MSRHSTTDRFSISDITVTSILARPARVLAALACCAALSLSAAGSAQATTLTITETGSSSRTILSSLIGETRARTAGARRDVSNAAQGVFGLEKFDTALGTLESITFFITTSFSRSVGTTTVLCRDSGNINASCASQSGSQLSNGFAAVDMPFDTNGFIRLGGSSISPSQFSNFTGSGFLLLPWQVSYDHSIRANCNPSFNTSIVQCRVSGSSSFTFTANASVT